jgi:hypothetical protein
MKIQDVWINTLNLVGRAWWVEVTTSHPNCIYYFGPFTTEADAIAAQPGYIADLESEMARGIQAVVKRCKPEQLTIDTDAASGAESTADRASFRQISLDRIVS